MVMIDPTGKEDTTCLASGTPEEIWEGAKYLLALFIRCKAAGPLDRNNPTETMCQGCAHDREEILNHMWHYAQAVLGQQET